MNALFRWLTRAAPLREQSRVYSGGMHVEDIEPRVLHSADLTPFAVPLSLPVHAEIRVVDNSGFGETAANIQQLTRHEVVFLDESVPDYQQILDDIDPLEAKRQQRAERRLEAAKAMSFGQCVEAYLAAHEISWKNDKHRQQWRMTPGR